ncbi:unnamed protein product, partial [Scytosiphon promiscuus]
LVTQDAEHAVLLLPCRHLCLCTGCSVKQDVRTCPVCRADINERLTIFN